MRTLHGIHVHGFPNAFIVQLTQGSNHIANVPHNMTETGTTIACVVGHAVANDHAVVEVTAESEEAWIQRLLGGQSLLRDLTRGDGARALNLPGSLECTPGYYNNEGREPTPAQRYNFLGFPDGPLAFFDHIDSWRTSGDFEGLTFT
ncbi:MAG: hypothetical protein WHU10_06860 [Fimbriimonadales bacterium]